LPEISTRDLLVVEMALNHNQQDHHKPSSSPLVRGTPGCGTSRRGLPIGILLAGELVSGT